MEVWKEISGTDGVYEVSNLGRVKSNDHICKRSSGVEYLVHGRIMKQTENNNGYMRVAVYVNGKKTKPYVHQLVANAFLPNPDAKSFVNHKDFNPKNNSTENLEWVSHLENIRYSLERGRFDRSPEWKSKLKQTLDDVMGTPVIGRNITTGEEMYFKALNDVRRLGFQPSCVCFCCKGKRATHGGFTWRYAEGDRQSA